MIVGKETTHLQDGVFLENSVNLHDMEKSLQIRNSTVEFLTFVLDGKEDGVQVMYTDETIWLTQDAIAVLFDKGRTTIVEHLKNIFNEGELDRDSVCRKFRHTASDGKNYSCSNRISIDSAILFWNFLMTSNKRSSLRIEYGRPIMHGRPNF